MDTPDRNYKLKKSHFFIEFPYICLSNLKFIEGRNSNVFHLKCSFCYPLDCAVWGSHATHPTLAMLLDTYISFAKQLGLSMSSVNMIVKTIEK
jgi:hypothetical protein